MLKNQTQHTENRFKCDMAHYLRAGIHRCIWILVLFALISINTVSATNDNLFDYYDSGNWDSQYLVDSDHLYGQYFTNGDMLRQLSNVSFYLSKNGLPSGTVQVEIYLGGTDYKGTGLVLATSNPINVSNISASPTYTLYNFTFSSTYLLQKNTAYSIMLNGSGLSGSIYFGIDGSTPSHGGYTNYRTISTGTWVVNVYSDSIFNAYESLSVTPIAPNNNSTQSKTYPPLTTNINFTWSLVNAANLLVSKDINFNLIAVDTTTSNNYSIQSLEAGNYWWKVRYYNSASGTYGNYSDTFNFTLSNTQTTSGTAIQGVVSERINGVVNPLDSVTVYIQSSAADWSNSMVTGTNGYYLFNGLSNTTTYYVYASKTEYTTSTAEYITTGSGTWITKDIQLKKTEPSDFESDKQYVKFRARWLWCFSNCDISGATISAYKSGEVVSYASGVTDTTGSISFRLYKSQLYRITVVNSTAGISQEMTIYPKDTEYVFLITNTETPYQDHPVQEKDAINIAVTKAITNATSATITVNYTDSLSGTTALTYYLNQSNNTVVQSWTWAAGTYNHTFTVSPYSGKSYVVHVVATQSTYGTIDRSYAVPFEKSSVGINGISNALWLWFAIAFMFFTGAIFTSSTAEKGLLIVCAEGWIFFFIGMFASLNSAQFVISLTLASVISVFAYFKRSQATEGFA